MTHSRRRVRVLRAAVWVLFFNVVPSAPAAACPSCAAGQAARREVWADGFCYNLAAALLPFVLVGAVSARLHRIGRARRPAAASRTAQPGRPRTPPWEGTNAT
jgi:hypothetical protein